VTADSLAAALRSGRLACGLSLRAVERKTGISNAHISQLETGAIAKPEMALLWELAAVYGLDFGLLLRLGGYDDAVAGGAEQRARITAALRALRRLDAAEQDQALRYMAELAHRHGRDEP
jgi:transcriptional regulator with XRE-family HTH domain